MLRWVKAYISVALWGTLQSPSTSLRRLSRSRCEHTVREGDLEFEVPTLPHSFLFTRYTALPLFEVHHPRIVAPWFREESERVIAAPLFPGGCQPLLIDKMVREVAITSLRRAGSCIASTCCQADSSLHEKTEYHCTLWACCYPKSLRGVGSGTRRVLQRLRERGIKVVSDRRQAT
jgi:hypothetical protein